MQAPTSFDSDTHRWDDALVALSDRLRVGGEPEALARVAMAAVAQELHVKRAGYGSLDAEGRIFTVSHDWVAEGIESLCGSYPVESRLQDVRVLRQGRGVVTGDMRESGFPASVLLALEAVSIRSQVCLPVLEDGVLAGVFFFQDDRPRDWSAAEVGFARDAVERVRHAIERRRAEQKLQELAWTLEQQVQDRTQALRDSEDFTRLALTATGGVGVWTYDFASDCFFCDASISDLYGIDPVAGAKGILRAGFLANVHPDDMQRLRTVMAGGSERSGDLEMEYRIRHPDGSVRWVLSRGHTYFDGDKPVRRTGVGIETTPQRQMEEQLRQAQKMESLGQLTGGIAHDFNNLLQGIVLPLQILQKRLSQQRHDGLEQYIEAGMAAAKRAAGLTQRLLAFARRQPLDSRTAELVTSLAGLEPMLRNTCGENIVLALDVPVTLWPVVTDVNQFESAVLNLAINARDAMPEGGTLSVTACDMAVPPGQKGSLASLPPGDYVRVTVADTGIGMSPDVIERAFDPFFTTKPIGQGTGLGLSMVYGYARQTGGLAVIDSTVGKGAAIAMYFPRALLEQPVDTVEKALPGPRGPQNKRVLVVEDDELVRRFAVELLREDGYTIREATTGHEAMSVLDTDRDFDLLLTDVGLPGPNGRQVADLARENIPGIKIILMTGYAEEAAHKNTFIGSGMQLIVKPFDAAVLVAKTRKVLAG